MGAFFGVFFDAVISIAQLVKNLPVVQETQVQFLGYDDALEKEMATHSRILTWKIPWMEEAGGLYSPWGCKRVRYNLVTKQQF